MTTLDPTTVVVNGVAFPNATIAATDPTDLNGDGFQDAIITITPRSNLNLLSTTTSLTLTAKTIAASLFPNQTFSSSATITVTGGATGGGGGGGGGGTTVTSAPIGTITQTTFLAPFGPDIYVPSLTTLSQLNTYKPIPAHVAIQQYLPGPGFAQRLYYYAHPESKPTHQFGNSAGDGGTTDGTTRSAARSSPGASTSTSKTIEFTHKKHVVPVNLQHEQLAGPIAGVTREPAAPRPRQGPGRQAHSTPGRSDARDPAGDA